jgi:hypothetical protein
MVWGLGQTHGLRNFRFDLAVHKMPFVKKNDEDLFDNILNTLIKSSFLKEGKKDLHYDGFIDDKITFSLCRGIHLVNNIDINMLPPKLKKDITKEF